MIECDGFLPSDVSGNVSLLQRPSEFHAVQVRISEERDADLHGAPVCDPMRHRQLDLMTRGGFFLHHAVRQMLLEIALDEGQLRIWGCLIHLCSYFGIGRCPNSLNLSPDRYQVVDAAQLLSEGLVASPISRQSRL